MWSALLDRGARTLIVWPATRVTNSRGTVEWVPDLDDPVRLRVSTSGDRSQIADLSGQVVVEVMRVKTRSYPAREGGTWSRCELDGEEYDLAEPPRYTRGASRSMSHWTFVLRSRAQLSEHEPGPVGDVPLIERSTR